MPSILRGLPFFDQVTTVEVHGSPYRILPLQIIVWVSLGPKGVATLPSPTPRFPAILDPAFTDTFLIHHEQLRRFAGLEASHLRQLGESLRAPERVIPLHAANLWLHRNRPDERDLTAAGPPLLLELHRGVGITAGIDLYPRLPLLGARALRGARLRLTIDYSRCRVHLRSARRFWFFA
jgi:hypothetical protein